MWGKKFKKLYNQSQSKTKFLRKKYIWVPDFLAKLGLVGVSRAPPG